VILAQAIKRIKKMMDMINMHITYPIKTITTQSQKIVFRHKKLEEVGVKGILSWSFIIIAGRIRLEDYGSYFHF